MTSHLGLMWNDDSSPYRSQPLAIRRRLEMHGIDTSVPPRPITARDLRNREIRKLRAQGWMLKYIAHRYRLSIPAVSRICRSEEK